jgi:hypothetical protein
MAFGPDLSRQRVQAASKPKEVNRLGELIVFLDGPVPGYELRAV